MWTRLIFLNVCGGLKFDGRINRDMSGFVKFPFSAHKAVAAKERTAVAIANGLILNRGGRAALESKRASTRKSFE